MAAIPRMTCVITWRHPFFQCQPERIGLCSFLYGQSQLSETHGRQLPTLQEDLYIHLADAYPLSRRPDGWVFFGGWVPAPGGHKVRVVIQQAAGKASLLENMYLVDVPEPSRDRPSDPPR